jgi:hypothetical protein
MTTITDLALGLPGELAHVPWWAWGAAFAMIFGGLLLPDQQDR